MAGSSRKLGMTLVLLLGGLGLGGWSGGDRNGGGADPAAIAGATARIEISLSARTLKLILDDGVAATYGVAIGTAEHPTPRGDFRIERIVWNPSWRPPDADWAEGKKPTPPGDPANPMGRVRFSFRSRIITSTVPRKKLRSAPRHRTGA